MDYGPEALQESLFIDHFDRKDAEGRSLLFRRFLLLRTVQFVELVLGLITHLLKSDSILVHLDHGFASWFKISGDLELLKCGRSTSEITEATNVFLISIINSRIVTSLSIVNRFFCSVSINFDMLHFKLILQELLELLIHLQILLNIGVLAFIMQVILYFLYDPDNLFLNLRLLIDFAHRVLRLRPKSQNLGLGTFPSVGLAVCAAATNITILIPLPGGIVAEWVWVFARVERVTFLVVSSTKWSVELVEVYLAIHLGNLTLPALSLLATNCLVTLSMILKLLILLILQSFSLLLVSLSMWKILWVKRVSICLEIGLTTQIATKSRIQATRCEVWRV